MKFTIRLLVIVVLASGWGMLASSLFGDPQIPAALGGFVIGVLVSAVDDKITN